MHEKLRILSFDPAMIESMSDWFTIEKIDATTYAISEYGHWEEPHCYLLIGSDEAVLIDTGLGVESIREQVEKITSLPVLAIITHGHWDHIGGVNEFSQVAIHKADSDWLEKGLPIPDGEIQENFALAPTTKPLPETFDLQAYTTPRVKPTMILEGGETIDLGERKIQIIHTPGHSPGSVCIYEPGRGYLFTGDTLYKGTLYMNYKSTDPILFAESIHRLSKLKPMKRILPGHHDLEIGPTLFEEADAAFTQLHRDKVLVRGSGLYEFRNLKILT